VTHKNGTAENKNLRSLKLIQESLNSIDSGCGPLLCSFSSFFALQKMVQQTKQTQNKRQSKK